jgi:hypothetical protein
MNESSMDTWIKKHKNLYSYISHSSFGLRGYLDFVIRLTNYDGDLIDFLQKENWDSDYIHIMCDITERYSVFFLTLSKDESKIEEDEFKTTQFLLCRFIILFTIEERSDDIITERAKMLQVFFEFIKHQIRDSDINVLITMFNQLMTVVQEYIGLTIQFFLCIPESELDGNHKKYINDKLAFVYENCDYFNSEYFALTCKFFKDIDDICIITNREIIFKKVYEAIFGDKMTHTLHKVHLDMKDHPFNFDIDFLLFCNIIKRLPELSSPLELQKSLIKQTSKEDIKKYLQDD